MIQTKIRKVLWINHVVSRRGHGKGTNKNRKPFEMTDFDKKMAKYQKKEQCDTRRFQRKQIQIQKRVARTEQDRNVAETFKIEMETKAQILLNRKRLEKLYSKEYLDRYFPIEPSGEDLEEAGYCQESIDRYFGMALTRRAESQELVDRQSGTSEEGESVDGLS